MKTHQITRRVIPLTVFWLVIQTAFAGAVFAQCITEAGEFEVNAHSSGAQKKPFAAGLADGGFVVTWEGEGQGDPKGIYGRVFDASGTPVGSEFRVNTYTNETQANPSAAGLPEGGFVVTWEGEGQGDPKGIFGRVFDASGTPVGSEFRVNTYTTKTQANPSAAALSGGGFVVTWQSDGQDGSGYGVYGQIFTGSGNPTGNEFPVNTYTNSSQGWPSVAGSSGGGFVVTWHSREQDGSDYGVYGQIFNSSGNKTGPEFPVNTYTTGSQYYPSAAALSGGGFVVTWMDSIREDRYHGVYGQVFDSSGTKVGGEFRVNTYTPSDQWRPSAAGLSGGGFAVAWESSPAQDGSGYGIYGQVFDSSGTKVGGEFRVNTYRADNQSWPSAAGLSGGGFVVAWESYGQDGSVEGIYGQRYACPNGGACRDELIVDFGEIYGLWHYDQEGLPDWSLLNAVDPDLMTALDINNDGRDELAASFSGHGLYIYDPINLWMPINSVTPENMIRLNDGVACDFGAAHGLWYWTEAGGWAAWNSVDPDRMLAVDIDQDGTDELVASFASYGLYRRNEAGPWTQMNTVTPENMIRLEDGVACDFGAAHGLWYWTEAGGWARLNDVDPVQMLSVDINKDGVEELVASFSGDGLKYYDQETAGWQPLNEVVPEEMKSINLRP
jgi:hypothetical protein